MKRWWFLQPIASTGSGASRRKLRRLFSAARCQAEKQAQQAATAFCRLVGPSFECLRSSVWLFGSVLEPSFSLNSDLDLCVEGLPSDALLEAMEVLDEALLRDAEPGQ